MKLDSEAGVILLGGNIGHTVSEIVSGYVAGAAQVSGWQRNLVDVGVKLLIGIGFLAGSEALAKRGKAKGWVQLMEGAGTGPVYTILNELVEASGVVPYAASYNEGQKLVRPTAPSGMQAPPQPSAYQGTLRIG